MSNCHYASYANHGVEANKSANMSQSVRVPAGGDLITVSGQGGWDRSNSKIPTDLKEEYDRAFDNVDAAIKDAGGQGISQVYKFVVYYAPMTDEALEYTMDNMKKHFPNHSPLLSCFGIEKLAIEGMRVEIEAWAHVP